VPITATTRAAEEEERKRKRGDPACALYSLMPWRIMGTTGEKLDTAADPSLDYLHYTAYHCTTNPER
jgi:hypothetical protein